jgi:hypothetical protein
MVPITFGVGRLKPTESYVYFTKYKEKDDLKKVPIKIANSAHIVSYPLDSLECY